MADAAEQDDLAGLPKFRKIGKGDKSSKSSKKSSKKKLSVKETEHGGDADAATTEIVSGTEIKKEQYMNKMKAEGGRGEVPCTFLCGRHSQCVDPVHEEEVILLGKGDKDRLPDGSVYGATGDWYCTRTYTNIYRTDLRH